MSLYNLLFGRNPFAAVLLEMLGTTANDVPRFRDCYLDEDGRIVIHTRTGGGNRDDYEVENNDLCDLPGYLFDRDDDFDCTYADFVYEVPEPFRPQTDLLSKLGAVDDPAAKWQAMLADLQSGKETPETARALEVGKRIFAQIEEAIKDKPA